MATHSSILAWRSLWTDKPEGLQTMGSQKVGHDWVNALKISSSCKSSIHCKPNILCVVSISNLVRIWISWRDHWLGFLSSLLPSSFSSLQPTLHPEHANFELRGLGLCNTCMSITCHLWLYCPSWGLLSCPYIHHDELLEVLCSFEASPLLSQKEGHSYV